MANMRRTYCKQCGGLGWVYSTPQHECDKTEKCPTCEGVGIQPGTAYYEREQARQARWGGFHAK